jgi:hypothetical protein
MFIARRFLSLIEALLWAADYFAPLELVSSEAYGSINISPPRGYPRWIVFAAIALA